jgi:hypothetical protein
MSRAGTTYDGNCAARMQPDELAKICEVMGSPAGGVWPEGQRLAAAMGFSFPQAQQQVREKGSKLYLY